MIWKILDTVPLSKRDAGRATVKCDFTGLSNSPLANA